MTVLRVGVIGTGYVGLVTGACLSELGHDVVCVDTDAMKIARLRNGEIPIYEPGLEKLVAENAERGKLRFTTAIDEAVAGGVDVLFIAVGTPSDGNGAADLGYVFAAVEQAARAIAAQKAPEHSFTVLVTKSTVPVGTSRKVAALAGAHLSAERFAVASVPFMEGGPDETRRPSSTYAHPNSLTGARVVRRCVGANRPRSGQHRDDFRRRYGPGNPASARGCANRHPGHDARRAYERPR